MSEEIIRPNRASSSEAASYVDKYDQLNQQMEKECSEIDAEMKRKKREVVKKYTDEQQGVLSDGKKNGVKKTLIRALADQAKLARKAKILQEKSESKIDELEDDDREFAIDIREALGDDFASFGLGAAAVEANDQEELDETTSAIIDAVQSDQQIEDNF